MGCVSCTSKYDNISFNLKTPVFLSQRVLSGSRKEQRNVRVEVLVGKNETGKKSFMRVWR